MAQAIGVLALAGSVIGTVSQLAGGGVQAAGAIYEGNAQADAADFNAQIAKKNAGLAITQSLEEERQNRIESRRALGGMQAAYSASGVTSDLSAMDVLQDNASRAEHNALAIRKQGEITADAYRNQATQYSSQASYYRTMGALKATGAILGTIGKVMPSLPTGTTYETPLTGVNYAGSDTFSSAGIA